MKHALIFDTETTGLIKNSALPLEQQPHIIEFYGCIVDVDNGEIIADLDFICNPGIPLETVITKITGITDADVANKPPFSEFESSVRQLISRADTIAAHNLSFDWDMLCLEFRRCETIDSVKWPMTRICTVEETEYMKGHRLNLSKLHTLLFDEPFQGAHRANVDVVALTRCFLELKKRGDI